MEEDFNLFVGAYWITGNFTINKAHLSVYCADQLFPPKNKLQCVIDLNHQCSPLASFTTGHQLCQFLKTPDNFCLCYQQRTLTFRWNLSAINFQKNIECHAFLKETQLTEVDILKYQNFMLKKKICQYEAQSFKTPMATNNEIPIENQKLKMKDISQTLLKIEEEVYPHISISSENLHRYPATDNFTINPDAKNKEKKKRGRPPSSDRNIAKKKQPQRKKMIGKGHKATSRKKSQKTAQKLSNQENQKAPAKLLDKQVISVPPSQNLAGSVKANDESVIVEQSNLRYKKTPIPLQSASIQSFGSETKKSRKKVRLEFENGDTYYGEVIKDVYNGYGVYSSKSGSYYEGYWKDGKAEGKGTSIDQFGNKYIGDFYCDKRHGQGTQIYENGQKYEGSFAQDFKWGYGKYIYQNGDYYQGQWQENMCNGKGKEVYVDGTIFKGNWKEDQKNGEGLLQRPNGQKFKQFYEMGELIQEILINDSPKTNQN